MEVYMSILRKLSEFFTRTSEMQKKSAQNKDIEIKEDETKKNIDPEWEEIKQIQDRRSFHGLNGLSDRLRKIDSPKEKHKLLQDLLYEASLNSDVVSMHFTYMKVAEEYKKVIKADTSYYSKLIDILKKDCDIYGTVIEVMKRESELQKLIFRKPRYPAFKELALAYERTNNYLKALEICYCAKELDVSEITSFDNRIEKLKRKADNKVNEDELKAFAINYAQSQLEGAERYLKENDIKIPWMDYDANWREDFFEKRKGKYTL